jgi:periplasmic protein TonB
MRESRIPSWIGSVLLHAGVVLLIIYVSFGPKLPPAITGVPVTLVSEAPAASVQPEPEVAPQETAPPPTPEATPAPPTPTPPTPASPKPVPKPQPTPPAPAPTKPGKTKPQPQKASPTPSTPFDPLAAARKDAGSTASAPHKPLPPGPSKGPPKVDLNPLNGGAALTGLVDKMNRLWSFNCSIPGNRDAVVPIRLKINQDGYLADTPEVVGGGSALFAGAGPAAVRALKAGEPYSTDEVPREYRNQEITINFRTKDKCGGH